MDSNNTVLVIASSHGSDAAAWSALVESLTESCGYRVLHASSLDHATEMLAGARVDLVIAEERASSPGGCEFLAGLRVSHPDVMRVLAFDDAVGDLSHAALYQFLRLPLDAEQARMVVARGLEARELSRRHRVLSREFKLSDHAHGDVRHVAQVSMFDAVVYASDSMAELCHQARVAAGTELPILIQGETGTGKALLARAIHDSSQRRGGPLVVQGCAGTPDAVLQSEVFGHKRGAFTGAVADRQGLLHAADGGTVLLDEISEVSPSFQIRLLRLLEDAEIRPLGGEHAVPANIRIIAASTRPLRALVASGEFRRDLYHRLRGFELEVPALRDRPRDIGPLAEFFARKHGAAANRKTLGISARALDKLTAYDWPGNVRELENEIRRLVMFAGDGEYITTQHMSPAVLAATRRPTIAFPWGGGNTLKAHVQNLEKYLVHQTLERCRWNQSKAAGELGLSRVGLANKIRRYRLAES